MLVNWTGSASPNAQAPAPGTPGVNVSHESETVVRSIRSLSPRRGCTVPGAGRLPLICSAVSRLGMTWNVLAAFVPVSESRSVEPSYARPAKVRAGIPGRADDVTCDGVTR